jgi:hypothetical protein
MVCGSLVLLLTPLLPLLGANRHWHNTVGNDLGIVAICAVLAAVVFWVGYRMFRAGLWIGPEGVVVRGPFRTKTLSLTDADSFVPGILAGPGNGTPCAMLKRHDGPPVGVWALGREGVIWRYATYVEEMKPLCDELKRCTPRREDSRPHRPGELPAANR